VVGLCAIVLIKVAVDVAVIVVIDGGEETVDVVELVVVELEVPVMEVVFDVWRKSSPLLEGDGSKSLPAPGSDPGQRHHPRDDDAY
jgi:hypothetical protein